MFDKFKEIDEKHEIEFLENGFVLRINGRDQNDGWLSSSYIFTTDVALFSAITEVAKLR